MYQLTLQREIGKRTNDEKLNAQIEYIVGRGLGGTRGKTWNFSSKQLPPIKKDNGNWIFTYKVDIKKISGQLGGEAEYKQWEEIHAMIQQTGLATKFQPGGWQVVNGNANTQVQETVTNAQPENFEKPMNEINNGINNILTEIIGIKTVEQNKKAKTWNDLIVDPNLLGPDSDNYISNHPAWKSLYGVNPQIRILLSNIQRAHHTNGESRNHAVLFGHSGCGKTTSMFALENQFGKDAVLRLDATSTTKAGLEKLFFSDLNEIPPLVFMEEAEKADPEALKIWLGALDDRGEIRKVNFRVNQLREIKILFICSVNDKSAFDRMMGSDGSQAGAMSSRCVTQVYYPRPSEEILYQILEKEIRDKGGKHEWISPAIELAKHLDVTDPRIVRSYLAGGDRLITGHYQRDWQANHEAQANFNKKNHAKN